ncbi:hypothetical protein GALL_445820 [mine drainage metagenome]|uniref:Uncharacterized protein n=1 Tax=mine drainage metagenome TaxID=410659 RepID=A0A1J5PSI9_9ZZZZ
MYPALTQTGNHRSSFRPRFVAASNDTYQNFIHSHQQHNVPQTLGMTQVSLRLFDRNVQAAQVTFATHMDAVAGNVCRNAQANDKL